MGDFLQFLAANPEIASIVAIPVGIFVIAFTAMFIIAFTQGREVSLWPPKIGSRPEAKNDPSKPSTGIRLNDPEIKLNSELKSKFFGVKPKDNCYIILNNNPRDPSGYKSMSHGDVETLVEAVEIVHELGGRIEVAPFNEKPKGVGSMTEFCIGGPDSNERTKAHLINHLSGLMVHDYAPGNPDSIAIEFEGKKYRYEKDDDGKLKQAYAILAKFYNNELSNSKPIFLICGQTSITNKSAIAYLIQNYEKLAKEFGDKPFCVIVKPRDYRTYGYQDVVRVDNLTGLIFKEK
jgi:hypothetical protein